MHICTYMPDLCIQVQGTVYAACTCDQIYMYRLLLVFLFPEESSEWADKVDEEVLLARF